MSTINLKGASGKFYEYTIYDASNTTWNDVSGNYVFAHKLQNGNWQLHYFGVADSFKNRFSSHERWSEAAKAGATHVMAHNNINEADRLAEEKDLISAYKTPLNTQHVKTSTGR